MDLRKCLPHESRGIINSTAAPRGSIQFYNFDVRILLFYDLVVTQWINFLEQNMN